MDDSEYLAAFEACAIANTEFHHADHIRVAWIYLERYPLLDAMQRFIASLRRFAAHHDVPMLYHETITVAYLLLIHERRNGEATFDDFRANNADLFTWKPSILDRYYSTETLASDRARSAFVLPDAHFTTV